MAPPNIPPDFIQGGTVRHQIYHLINVAGVNHVGLSKGDQVHSQAAHNRFQQFKVPISVDAAGEY